MRAVGLVGCGSWGVNILRDLLALGCAVEVVARSDASVQRGRQAGADRIVSSISELGQVDGIVVATPETTHASVIERALERGVPVFAEKPLTVDPASAERLAAAAPGRLFVMDKWRYHPGVEALAALARTGELGAVEGLVLKRRGWGSAHPTSDSIWHLAPHDLAITLEILGEIPQPRSAVAEVVDGHPTGLHGVLGVAPWVALEVSSAYPTHSREVGLICAEGVAWLTGAYADELVLSADVVIGAEPERRPIGDAMPLERELTSFLAHLGGGPTPRSSAAEGAEIVGVIGRLRELAGLPRASPEGDSERAHP